LVVARRTDGTEERATMEEDSKGTALSNVIRIDDARVKDHLDKIVRGTVEETLNAMLDAEAGRL